MKVSKLREELATLIEGLDDDDEVRVCVFIDDDGCTFYTENKHDETHGQIRVEYWAED